MNLSKLKLGQEELKKEDKVEEMPLGFEEESQVGLKLSKLKKNIFKVEKEILFSGILKNFWLWNIVFLHICLAVILLFLLHKYYSVLPNEIGINLDNSQRLDTLVNKSVLKYFVFIHLAIPVFTIAFAIKNQKRLNPLFVLAFLNYLVLGIIEFLALKDPILYFI